MSCVSRLGNQRLNWGEKGSICPRPQHFGGAKLRWKCYVIKRNFKCQRILIIASYKVSNASGCYPVAKSCHDYQARFAKRAVTNFSDVLRWTLSLHQSTPTCGLLTSGSQCFNIARLANVPTSLSFCSCVVLQDGNPGFTVHAVCYCACFQISGETYISLNCYDNRLDDYENFIALVV